jgi:hypothetical protein
LATIKYLTVEQALADHAAVVTAIQQNVSEKRAVINFGGSYSGATAAWFRCVYKFNGTFPALHPPLISVDVRIVVYPRMCAGHKKAQARRFDEYGGGD